MVTLHTRQTARRQRHREGETLNLFSAGGNWDRRTEDAWPGNQPWLCTESRFTLVEQAGRQGILALVWLLYFTYPTNLTTGDWDGEW